MSDLDVAPPDRGPIAGRTMRASAWVLSSVVYGRCANLLMTIILARILVPADFGLVALGTTLLLILSAITDLSLGAVLIHHRDLTRDDYDTAFTLGLLRGVLLAGVMVGGGFVMAQAYGDPRLIGIAAGLSVRALLSGMGSPRYVGFVKELDFGLVARTEAMSFTAQLVVAVAIAYFTQSYWAIVAGAVSASLVSMISTYWVAPYRPRWSLASWRKFISFSVWLTLTQVVTMVGNRFDNFLAGGFLGTAVFGAYSVGNNVASMITQAAIQPLERVLFPSFAKIVLERQRLANAFERSQSSLFAIGLPIGVGFALIAEPFVYLALGPRWAIAATVIQFIAPILGVQIVFGPVNSMAYALGATKALFRRSLVMLVVRVPLVLVGLFGFGLIGLLTARVISGALHSVVNMLMIRQLIDVSPLRQLVASWRSFASALVMVGAVLALRPELPPVDGYVHASIALAAMVATGAVTYCGTHAGLWLLVGRPSRGVETEIAGLAGKLMARINLRRRRPAE